MFLPILLSKVIELSLNMAVAKSLESGGVAASKLTAIITYGQR
ncbi:MULTISPECIES: hypothetical protein [Microcystis]|nr:MULTISPECIES: hypothetical protein [Microcystis]